MSLELLGYERPHRRWLVCHLALWNRAQMRADLIDPFLMPRDVRRLSRILRKVGKNKQDRVLIEFLEPTLSLTVRRRCGALVIHASIRDGPNGTRHSVATSGHELRNFAVALGAQLDALEQ